MFVESDVDFKSIPQPFAIAVQYNINYNINTYICYSRVDADVRACTPRDVHDAGAAGPRGRPAAAQATRPPPGWCRISTGRAAVGIVEDRPATIVRHVGPRSINLDRRPATATDHTSAAPPAANIFKSSLDCTTARRY